MMTEIKGITIVVEVNEGTVEAPKWTKAASQRGATLNRSAETMETTSKDSEGFKDFEYGFKEWSINCDGLLVTDDKALQFLEKAWFDSTKVRARMAFASGNHYSGMCLVTDLPIEAPYDDTATYTATLQGAGKLERIEGTPEVQE